MTQKVATPSIRTPTTAAAQRPRCQADEENSSVVLRGFMVSILRGLRLPAMLLRTAQVVGLTELAMKCIDPSHMATLTPPGCRLRDPMK